MPDMDISSLLRQAVDLHTNGQLEQARRAYEHILSLGPDNAQALHLLGVLHAQAGDVSTAATLQGRAVALEPDTLPFVRDLCTTLRRGERWEDCVEAARAGLARFPNDFPLAFALAESLYHLARFEEIPCLLASIPKGHPQSRQALFLRANARHELHDSARAMDDYRALLLEHDAWTTPARMNLALLHKERGQVEKAFALYHEASRRDPHSLEAKATALFFRHYIPGSRPQDFHDEARQWASRFDGLPALASAQSRTTGSHAPGSPLRVGLLSGDFRAHAVGTFLLPALRALVDLCGDKIDLHLFSNNPFNDSFTQQFSDVAQQFTDIRAMDDAAAAQCIARCRPDLLLDISGLSPNCRPGVMARRPAPVQALWLGYFNTTGLDAMDWIVADRHVLPPKHDDFYVEQPLRLPASFFCYSPPTYDVHPAGNLPARSNGYVTFGCCNDTAKLNAEVLTLWADILQRVPGSRLLLKSKPFADAAVRDAFIRRFAALDIGTERLDLRPASGHEAYFAAYRNIDLALDPFPYNGGTITCDALWMGVPVVTLSGKTFAGRMGRSVLAETGLCELVVNSPSEYADLAASLGKDLDRLAGLRHNLRQRFTDCPVCDMLQFAKDLAKALHAMASSRR